MLISVIDIFSMLSVWINMPRVNLHPELLGVASGGSASCLTGGGSYRN